MNFPPSTIEKSAAVLLLSAALFLLVVGAVAITQDIFETRCECAPEQRLLQ